MNSTKTIFIAVFMFVTSLPAFAQEVPVTNKNTLSAQQIQLAFSTQDTPQPLMVLTEGEMRQIKGASHYILINIGGTLYQINLPD